MHTYMSVSTSPAKFLLANYILPASDLHGDAEVTGKISATMLHAYHTASEYVIRKIYAKFNEYLDATEYITSKISTTSM